MSAQLFWYTLYIGHVVFKTNEFRSGFSFEFKWPSTWVPKLLLTDSRWHAFYKPLNFTPSTPLSPPSTMQINIILDNLFTKFHSHSKISPIEIRYCHFSLPLPAPPQHLIRVLFQSKKLQLSYWKISYSDTKWM